MVFFYDCSDDHRYRRVLTHSFPTRLSYDLSVQRGVYERSPYMKLEYEAARKRVAGFIGEESADEVVFGRGATEGINLVAQCWAGTQLRAGDRILLSTLEHHSNIDRKSVV